jgi:CubicO group peptidase (beta-lactamase class C family)
MKSTGWFLSDIDRRRYTTHYVSHNGHTVPIPAFENTTYPDGGVRTSLDDLAKFFIALLNGGAYRDARILDESMTREMLRFQFTDANRPRNYAANEGNSGLFWRTKRNGQLMGHGGNDPGIAVEMLTDESRRVGIIVLSNTSLSGDEQVAYFEIVDQVWSLAQGMAARSANAEARP